MQALLNSDKLITNIAIELHGRAILDQPRRLAAIRDGLRRSISISSTGPEFVTVRLRGGEAVGMARTLNVVVAKLLETVLSTEIDAPAAPQVVRARMVERLREAHLNVRALASSPFLQALAQSLPTDPAGWNTVLEAKQAEWTELLRIEAKSTGPTASLTVDPGASRSDGLLVRTSTSQAGIATDFSFARIELARARVREEIEVVRTMAVQVPTGAAATTVIETHRRRLQEAVTESTRALDRWHQRFGGASATGLSFMRAPERILVIDPPHDPDVPMVSRSFIALLVLFAGALVAFGAALMLELFDRRVRTLAQMSNALGVPVLAHIPPARD
jgi:hypothetical protein